jgi:CDP-diacylglycerol--serine O-phosphatidyltransferase
MQMIGLIRQNPYLYFMKQLPNLVTLLNLIAGLMAILSIAGVTLSQASWWIILALFLDLLDGSLARLLNARSSIGRQLDSLADMVSFGVAPGLMMYMLLSSFAENEYLPYAAFLLPVFAAVRLARFNVDPAQEKDFSGLPVPAAALMILSIPMALNCKLGGIPWLNGIYSHPVGLLLITLALSVLMVSPLRLFSLKISSIYWKHNRGRYILIAFAVLSFLLYRFAAIPFILGLYIILSLLKLNDPVTVDR